MPEALKNGSERKMMCCRKLVWELQKYEHLVCTAYF